MTDQGATSQSSGSLHRHEPTAEHPHAYLVWDPTKADIDNAANSETYPRYFGVSSVGNGYMVAFLLYHKKYRPQSRFDKHNYRSSVRFIGNRNAKYRLPAYHHHDADDYAMDAFRKWWCQLPNTVAERKYLFGQVKQVLEALHLNDVPLAIALLQDVNLAVSDQKHISLHVKSELITALEQSMFPRMWDYMDPATRPTIPYIPPDLSNSGTISGTLSGTSITVTTHGGASA